MSKKKEGPDGQASGWKTDTGHELWGVIFLALGVLVVISLVSGFVTNTENILGRYLGTFLSSGLVYLFGPLPSVMFPLGILFIGWKRLTGERLSAGMVAFAAALLVEICLFFSLGNLPAAASGNFHFSDNCVGNSLTFFLHYVFGAHRFGPYFLVVLALAITLCLGLKLRLSVIADFARAIP